MKAVIIAASLKDTGEGNTATSAKMMSEDQFEMFMDGIHASLAAKQPQLLARPGDPQGRDILLARV